MWSVQGGAALKAPVALSAGIPFSATSDGFVVTMPTNGCTWSYHSVFVNGVWSAYGKAYDPAGSFATTTVPVAKGQIVLVTQDYGCAPSSIRFYPMK